MATTTETHGLAGKIRASKASDTFDLAGLNSSTIAQTMKDAFSSPFIDLPPDIEMIRITLVTGAGKLGRARYDDNAAKIVGQELRALGYEQDSSASCVAACAGSFKSQHDTGKNLKTIVVFPKVQTASAGTTQSGNGAETNDGLNGDISSLLSKPEEMIAISPASIFQNLVETKCPSWSEKKGCHQSLIRIQEMMQDMEQRLMQGQALTDAEQSIYDSVSIDGLKEKHDFMRNLMQDQVESGNITGIEKKQLMSQVKERLESLNEELATAQADSKLKKIEKLNVTKNKLTKRLEMLEKTTPKPPRPLKFQAEIGALQRELTPLLKLEENAKGRLLSLKETQQLSRKDEILHEIHELEQDSRGTFESDESFADRVERCKASTTRQGKKDDTKNSKKASASTSAAGRSATSSKSSTNAWMTSSAKTTSSRLPLASSIAAKKTPGTKNTTKGGASGLFAAMMLDDSDSD
jgi:hypothetical protein